MGKGDRLEVVCLIAGSMAQLGYETGARGPLMQQMTLHLDRAHRSAAGAACEDRRATARSTWRWSGAHGAPPAPAPESRERMAVHGEQVAQAVERALAASGSGHVEKYVYPFLYLNTDGFRDPEPIREAAARAALAASRGGGLFHRGRRLLGARRLGAPLPQQLPPDAVGRRDAVVPARVRGELRAGARRLVRVAIQLRRARAAVPLRSAVPRRGSSSRRSEPWISRRRWRARWAWRRPRRRPAACWARRWRNDACETTLCGIALRNPVLAASGTFGYGVEFEKQVDLNELGGFVVKGLSREPIEGNPPPRLYETRCGMINSIGLQNIGVRAFVKEKLPALAKLRTAVFANIFGYETADYVEVVRVLEDHAGIAGYELNVSCPNTKHGGIFFSSDPALLGEVVSAVKRVARRPVIVKLSPNVSAIEPLARAAEESGADAVSLVNTFIALAIDARTRRPRIGAGFGGLSGPAIKPIALRLVLPGGARREDPGGRSRRDRDGRGRGGIPDRGGERGRGRDGELLGSGVAAADRAGAWGVLPAGAGGEGRGPGRNVENVMPVFIQIPENPNCEAVDGQVFQCQSAARVVTHVRRDRDGGERLAADHRAGGRRRAVSCDGVPGGGFGRGDVLPDRRRRVGAAPEAAGGCGAVGPRPRTSSGVSLSCCGRRRAGRAVPGLTAADSGRLFGHETRVDRDDFAGLPPFGARSIRRPGGARTAKWPSRFARGRNVLAKMAERARDMADRDREFAAAGIGELAREEAERAREEAGFVREKASGRVRTPSARERLAARIGVLGADAELAREEAERAREEAGFVREKAREEAERARGRTGNLWAGTANSRGKRRSGRGKRRLSSESGRGRRRARERWPTAIGKRAGGTGAGAGAGVQRTPPQSFP